MGKLCGRRFENLLRRLKCGLICACLIGWLGSSVMEACTVFAVRGPRGLLLASNEDWPGFQARLWVVPASSNGLGYTYVGFAEGHPEGGINEAGLCFDGLGLPQAPPSEYGGKPKTQGSAPIVHFLAHCRTVAEALTYLQGMDWDGLRSSQLMLADRTGAAAVIGPGGVTLLSGDFLLATNRAATEPLAQRRTCQRFRMAEEVLGTQPGSLELCRRVLSRVRQEGGLGGTQYSVIFDIAEARIHLYWFHDFEQVQTLSVEALLRGKAESFSLSRLVGTNFAAESLASSLEQESQDRSWMLGWVLLWFALLGTFSVVLQEIQERRVKGRRPSWFRVIAGGITMLLTIPLLAMAPWLGLMRALNTPPETSLLTQAMVLLPACGALGLMPFALWTWHRGHGARLFTLAASWGIQAACSAWFGMLG